MNILSYWHQKKKKKHKHMKFYNFLVQFFIFLNYHKIIHYQLSLFIVNMGWNNHFILLCLYNIFFLLQFSLSICHRFYKIFFKKMTKLNSLTLYYIDSQNHVHLYINNTLGVYLINQILENSLTLLFFFSWIANFITKSL